VTPEGILHAARRQIPVAFRGKWINQRGVVKLTPSTYEVEDVVGAGVSPDIGNAAATPLLGLQRLRRYAARRCGHAVADVSWAVVFSVPEAQSVMYGTGVAYLAPTRHRRWRLWYALVL